MPHTRRKRWRPPLGLRTKFRIPLRCGHLSTPTAGPGLRSCDHSSTIVQFLWPAFEKDPCSRSLKSTCFDVDGTRGHLSPMELLRLFGSFLGFWQAVEMFSRFCFFTMMCNQAGVEIFRNVLLYCQFGNNFLIARC